MKYERFTQWTDKGASLILDNPKNVEEARTQLMEKFKSACNKLAEIEDKIENGTLIELPCKVGDTAYLVHRDKPIIECWTVTQFSVEEAGLWLHIRNEKLLSAVIHSKSRGVCFTREEAEKRLKELQK